MYFEHVPHDTVRVAIQLDLDVLHPVCVRNRYVPPLLDDGISECGAVPDMLPEHVFTNSSLDVADKSTIHAGACSGSRRSDIRR
jgi:hypothetical protein